MKSAHISKQHLIIFVYNFVLDVISFATLHKIMSTLFHVLTNFHSFDFVCLLIRQDEVDTKFYVASPYIRDHCIHSIHDESGFRRIFHPHI